MWKFGLIVFLLLLYVGLANFSYINLEDGCFIFVKPSITPSNWNAKEVIDVVKANDTESYRLMCKHVSALSKNIPMGCAYVDGGCYNPKTKNTLYLGNDMDNLAITSAILVHEICHLKQDLDNRAFDEFECYSKDARFLKEIQIL